MWGGVGRQDDEFQGFLLKSPVYQYDGRTGKYGRVRNICMEVERVASPKVVIKAGYSGSHL